MYENNFLKHRTVKEYNFRGTYQSTHGTAGSHPAPNIRSKEGISKILQTIRFIIMPSCSLNRKLKLYGNANANWFLRDLRHSDIFPSVAKRLFLARVGRDLY